MIGHNRWATTGQVTRKNAHPFDFDTLIGAHNGTLKNKNALDDGTMFEVDSEVLYHNFEKNGIGETIKRVDGAYALTWYNKDDKTINFLRNKERPLFYAITKDKKCIFWASEVWMLQGMLTREGVEFEKIFVVNEDTHFSFVIPELDKPFEKAIARPMKQEAKPNVFIVGGIGKSTKKDRKHHRHMNLVEQSSRNISTAQIVGTTSIFHPLVWGKENSGAYYVSLNSPSHSKEFFRVYLANEKDCVELMKVSRWEGVIGEKSTYFYKVSYGTLTAKPLGAVSFTQKKQDHRGFHISKYDFHRKYTACAFCDEVLKYEDNFIIMNDVSALCGGCASDPEIRAYLPEMKGKSNAA